MNTAALMENAIQKKNAFQETAKAYRYDGSFAGFLSCIFEAFLKKEIPSAILEEDRPATLFPEKWIETDREKARRVYTSLRKKGSPEAQEQVRLGFLTCQPEKDLLLFRFIRLLLEEGSSVTSRLADPVVNTLFKAVQFLRNESHLTLEFLRFSDHSGVLTSIIEPKNHVLPIIAGHFSDRFSGERFLIWDKTHREALLHVPNQWEIIPLASFTPPPPSKAEAEYRRLWKRFYNTISNEARYNPKCRQTHMPKRYWSCMTEFQPDEAPLEEGLETSGTRGTEAFPHMKTEENDSTFASGSAPSGRLTGSNKFPIMETHFQKPENLPVFHRKKKET